MAKRTEMNKPAAQLQPAIYYSLHTFLETIRSIKTYEDPLCTLLHSLQTTGTVTEGVKAEIHSLLEEMPATVYAQELHAVLHALEGASASPESSVAASAHKSRAGLKTRPKAAKRSRVLSQPV